MTSDWLAAAITPAVVTWVFIAVLLRTAWAARLADHPNERSLHANPTPRVGGLAILAATFPFAWLYASGPLAITLACALGLALVSLADDLRSQPISIRLGAHVAAAVVAVISTGEWPGAAGAGAWLACAAAIVAIVWAANLFNFMDGADGLAGGMAVVGFGAYAIAASRAGEAGLALVTLALASASAGFVVHNFPPARVFMGDAGSIPLGFLAATLGLHGVASGIWPIAFPVLVFSPFAVDATVTLLRRLARREPFWRAHRGHYYQRLALSGWTRRRLTLASWALMIATSASALALPAANFMLQCGIIFGWAVAYALMLLAIDRSTKTIADTAK